MANSENGKRVIYTDILRIVASVCVVIIHVSGEFVVNPALLGTRTWWVANILDSFIRWCVPVFFMLSGAFILDSKKDYGVVTFIRKRVSKVFIPFIVWSILYVVFNFRDKMDQITLENVVSRIITGNTHYHLWFFYTLIGLYLVAPVLKAIVRQCDRNTLLYFIGLCYVNVSILGFLSKFFHINVGFSIPLGSAYVGYFVLGNVLLNWDLRKSTRCWLYALGGLGIVVTMAGSYLISGRAPGVDLYFYEYTSVNTFFVSIAVFVLFKNINWEKAMGGRPHLYKGIRVLTDASLGIYLIHPAFLKYTEKVPFIMNMRTVVYILFTSIALYIASFLAVSVLKKLPVVRHIVP